ECPRRADEQAGAAPRPHCRPSAAAACHAGGSRGAVPACTRSARTLTSVAGNPARDPMSPLRPVVAWTLCLVCLTCSEDSTRSGPTGPRAATLAPTGTVLVGAGDIARCDGKGDEATA